MMMFRVLVLRPSSAGGAAVADGVDVVEDAAVVEAGVEAGVVDGMEDIADASAASAELMKLTSEFAAEMKLAIPEFLS